jgi:hypothetical protein
MHETPARLFHCYIIYFKIEVPQCVIVSIPYTLCSGIFIPTFMINVFNLFLCLALT